MLILGDKGHYYGRFPWVTMWLVVANVLVFTFQIIIGEAFTNGFSMVPEEITTFQDLKGTKYRKVKVEINGYHDHRGHYVPQYTIRDIPIKHYPGPFPIFLTLFTSMFMHGGFLHLFFNMWFLLIFGRNVECAMGPRRFLVLYLICGLLAGLAHIASDMHSIIPCLGASGAIAGVMGAYVSIYPLNKIKIWFGLFIGVVEVPALVVIGFWVLLQYLSAVMVDDKQTVGGVAYWAHLGGFFAGLFFIRATIMYLQQQVAASEAAKEAALAPAEPSKAASPAAPIEVKPEPPDPYAGFVTMQTIRRMQEEKKRKSAPV